MFGDTSSEEEFVQRRERGRGDPDEQSPNMKLGKNGLTIGQNSTETLKNWQNKLNEIQVPKTLMNKLVLNFLIVEGYKEGAKKFLKEANIDLEDPVNYDMKVDFNEELID